MLTIYMVGQCLNIYFMMILNFWWKAYLIKLEDILNTSNDSDDRLDISSNVI